MEKEAFEACNSCQGTGSMNNDWCGSCGGTGGNFANPGPQLPAGPNNFEACPNCQGSGSVNNVACPSCQGNGGRWLASVHTADNPAQAPGYLVPPDPAETAFADEARAAETQKRQDTAQWEDVQNRHFVDGQDPVQTVGPYPNSMVARVFVADDASTVKGAKVLLKDKEQGITVAGKVVLASEDEFAVEWNDGNTSVEDKSNYELIRTQPE